MELSVVILNYNVRHFLEQCIRTVQAATASLNAEIIVIDNNSPDTSAEMVKILFPEIIYIQNTKNVGFSTANNQAVKVAKGEYICILNPDTAVAEDTFVKALDYYKKTPGIGALGVRLMDGTGNFLPESKRNLPTPLASLLKLLGIGGKYYAEHIPDNGCGEIEILVGAFMLIEKDIYDSVGGFDEDYFMYGEDIDLSYKIIKAGYKNHYFGKTTVLHYKGESTQRDESYYNRFYGAMTIFYRKHFNRNFLLEKLVNVGVNLAKWKNKNQKPKKITKLLEPKQYVIVSDNERTIDALGRVFGKSFTTVLKNEPITESLIIFDADFISYKEIFDRMTLLSRNSNQFRIKPKNADFILGSDRSDEKGVVKAF